MLREPGAGLIIIAKARHWGKAMAVYEVSPVERLARQICKDIGACSVSTIELRSRLAARRVASAAALRRNHWRLLKAADFDDALAHAQSSGWVVETEGCVCLTEAGSALARRSRVGVRRARVMA
jgi:hypothetical protein